MGFIFGDDYGVCMICGDEDGLRTTADGKKVCRICLSIYYAQCVQCGRFYNKRKTRLKKVRGGVICPNCAR